MWDLMPRSERFPREPGFLAAVRAVCETGDIKRRSETRWTHAATRGREASIYAACVELKRDFRSAELAYKTALADAIPLCWPPIQSAALLELWTFWPQ